MERAVGAELAGAGGRAGGRGWRGCVGGWVSCVCVCVRAGVGGPRYTHADRDPPCSACFFFH